MKKLLIIILLLTASENFSQGFWKVIGKMPHPVSGGGVVLYDNKIYIIGGYSDSLQSAVDWIQEFDPNVAVNSWKIVGNINQPRNQVVAEVWNSYVMFFGGVDYTSADRNNLEFWNFVEFENPNTFDTKDNFGRSLSTGHIKDNKLYIIGGNPIDANSTLPFITEYDLIEKNFTFSYESSEAPQQHMTFLLGDNIYIFGGYYNYIRNNIRKFNVNTKEYVLMNEKLITPRAGGAAVYNTIKKRGYIIGGYNEENRSLKTVEEITLNTNTGALNIKNFPQLNFERSSPVVVNYLSTIVVFGGRDLDGNVVRDVEIYIDTTTSVDDNIMPTEIKLYQNYPNPFNPTTKITFDLKKTLYISLDIYSALGEHIVTLQKGEFMPGSYSTVWNGKDKNNNDVSSGVFFYRLSAGNYVQTKKMLLIK